MIVTAHQPNFLPGISVIEKMLAADAMIWLDQVLYSPGGWTNRNRLPSGAWLTVPVSSGARFKPINQVEISEHGNWRVRASKSLRQEYRGDWVDEVCDILGRPYRLLVGLNMALLQIVLRRDAPTQSFQSHLDSGRVVTAVSDYRGELLPISVRLAMMVQEVGGTVYLSGPSGRNYLDERPFEQRGIRVDYWQHSGPNPCCLTMMETHVVR